MSALKISEYTKERNALLQNCDIRSCLANVDPNWPEGATSDSLGLVCATTSVPTSGYFIKMSGMILILVTVMGVIDL